MKDPRVTVVSVTYNAERYVRDAIESVLCQSFTDFEYLIADDASTDATWEIIKEYEDPRILRWQNESNLGEYPNRNSTLERARGKYILWVDGDDILYPHGLEFMVGMLDAFPSSALACCRPHWPTMVYPYELQPAETYRFDFFGSPVTINGFPDTLFRTEILKRAGGLPETYLAGDTFIKRKIAMSHPILLISNGVSWWRSTPGQASEKARNSTEGLDQELEFNRMLLESPDCPLDPGEKEKALVNLFTAYLKKAFRKQLLTGRPLQFIRSLGKVNGNLFRKLRYLFSPVLTSYRGDGTPQSPLKLPFNHHPRNEKK